jgi:hypothetical protein
MGEVMEYAPSTDAAKAPAAPPAGNVQPAAAPAEAAPKAAPAEPEESAPAPLSEEEQRAVTEGWRPLSDWKGDTKKWVPASDYMRDLPFKKHISQQTRKIRELENTIQSFQGHMSKVEERAYQKAWDRLQQQRNEAILLGDLEGVSKIETEMTEIHKEVAAIPRPVAAPAGPVEPPPEAISWAERNPWFFQDVKMGGYARLVNEEFLRDHPEATAEQQLANTEKEVRQRFPEKFENSRRQEPPSVEGGTFSGANKSRYTYNDLTAEQRRICDSFVNHGMVKDRQSYVNDLVDIGEIGGKR